MQALVLIGERTVINEAFLRRMAHLKLISQTGKVARNIDLDACTQAGVAVVEGVGSPTAPAELTWLLIMASCRNLLQSVNAMAAGQWQGKLGCVVYQQRLGIHGYGKIGKMLAGYGKAFGMKVQIWGSERARLAAKNDGLQVPESREEFFATRDVLSVHQRLTTETQGNITQADLSLMQPDALFVNTSRAELVAPEALFQTLRQGRFRCL